MVRTGSVRVIWTPPGEDAEALDLSDAAGGLVISQGPEGFGAAPRTITRQARATGGARARWSYAAERLVTIPIAVFADAPGEFLQRRRALTRAFTATAPAAGTPRPGLLRVQRADGQWREIACVYLDGLTWADENGRGRVHDIAVVQLVAPDPWWYGQNVEELTFRPRPPRNYLSPYQTVSPDRTIGARTVHVDSDAPVAPVWTITGPARSVSARYADEGPGWTFGRVRPGETITIDVAAGTVVDQDGDNRIGDLAWPTSTLFWLHPGDNHLLLSLAGGDAGTSLLELAYRPRYETV